MRTVSLPRSPSIDSAVGTPNPLPDWLALTARYASEVNYGQILLTIHQGEVIEVQKTERTRLASVRRK